MSTPSTKPNRLSLYSGQGYVERCYMGGTEEDIIRAARMSTHKGFQGWDTDHKLLKYLWDNKHVTPFEFVTLTFEISAPIFVARQVFRHRTFSYNELSGRYSEIPENCYIPEKFGKQDTKNKQGSTGEFTDTENMDCGEIMQNAVDQAFSAYRALLAKGVSKEQARFILPVNTFTKWRQTGNLRNWLHFLSLRLDAHAQKETRELAEMIAHLTHDVCPLTINLALPGFCQGLGNAPRSLTVALGTLFRPSPYPRPVPTIPSIPRAF